LIALCCELQLIALTAPLDLHDAQSLVEHTPAFLRALETGSCPETSDSTVNDSIATIIVRAGCKRFDWIATLYVDLRTGQVTKDGGPSGPILIETPILAKLRSGLLRQREESRLTAPEATCLLEKLKILAAQGPCNRAKIVREEASTFTYSIENACAMGDHDKTGMVIVDRYSYAIADAKSGNVYKSETLEAVRQLLAATRAPARLTVEESRRLAASPAVIAELQRKGLLTGSGCLRAEVEGTGLSNADEIWVQVAVGCDQDKSVARLSVNALTGSVRVVGPNNVLDSAALRLLQESALGEARARKTAAVTAFKEQCR
jgi:hypothetical protein